MGMKTNVLLSIFASCLVIPSFCYREQYGPLEDRLDDFNALKQILLQQQYGAPSYDYASDDGVTDEVFEVNLLMPNITPQHANDYKCFSVPTPPGRPAYIVGFEPQATMETAHHMLLYGCEEPGSDEEVWDCGEMSGSADIENHTPCQGMPRILYAWAMDAPPLELPEGIGFEVGGRSPIKHLVLQVHYATAEPFKDGSTDDSGITLKVTEQKQKYQAGVYFMGTDGEIPAHSTVHLEAACMYQERPVMHPFAFRVHAHKLGTVISAYRVRGDEQSWTEIGKQDPHLPQMFYPVQNKDITIEYDDILAMRCTMTSDRDKSTFIGPTGDDEMCNFYMMYYTDAQTLPKEGSCYTSAGFEWADYLTNIPDKEASTLPKDSDKNDGEKPEP